MYFVAKLLATIQPWGPVFDPNDVHQAELRAASTLAQMAFIRGQSLQFLRLAIPWDEPTTAAFLGITVPELQSYEAETATLPRDAWLRLAAYVAHLDGRFSYDVPPVCPMDMGQPRVIRVYPDFPMKSNNIEPLPGCTPC